MQLNEVTEKLPPHLLQFVVDQPYHAYTSVDQAVWRYVMRQNYYHLKKVAHESYVQGLHLTGVEIEQIPTMYGMNRILKEIGWAAVAVDGFIPPGAFMEFTKYNVLVIAADIRTLDHIEYTPAPDVIHESAGHAPILAVPEFAEYLKHIGEVGCKAFSSQKDVELYEAIRHLSIIKEDPGTPEIDISRAEKEIERLQGNMGISSEMALIRNLHWWTVEYGLIGTTDNFKLYGAGLLSSIGEGMSCQNSSVKKIPYTLEAMHCNYDITKPQPQLFVTPDFAHLTMVLNQFKKTMAWSTGGLEGIQKAIASQQVGTCVYSSGLQVSGLFTEVLHENGVPVFLRTTGPSMLAINDEHLEGFGKEKLVRGFASPIGRLKVSKTPFENMTDAELNKIGISQGKESVMEFEYGVVVKGRIRRIVRSEAGKIVIIEMENAGVTYAGRQLINEPEYILGVGEKVVSAFAGPADVGAFEPVAFVPKEKMHKLHYDERALRLQGLYRTVREVRQSKLRYDRLAEVWKTLVTDFPHDWLLPLEMLEITEEHDVQPQLSKVLLHYLEIKKEKEPHLAKLISNGLFLMNRQQTLSDF